jgi:hypothetical protein
MQSSTAYADAVHPQTFGNHDWIAGSAVLVVLAAVSVAIIRSIH